MSEVAIIHLVTNQIVIFTVGRWRQKPRLSWSKSHRKPVLHDKTRTSCAFYSDRISNFHDINLSN